MNLSQIRNECWAVARDTALVDGDKLWPKAEMNTYINRIYRYIARETRCIKDSYTASVCQIEVAPPADAAALEALAATDPFAAIDWAEYNRTSIDINTGLPKPDSWLYHKLVAPRIFPLHPAIIDIDECKWRNAPWRLTKVSVTKWQQNPYWERVIGYPTEFCTDYTNNSIALNFRTDITDTLLMIVKRLPLMDLSMDNDVPEFRQSYHDFFKNGVLWLMHSKQDADAVNVTKSAEYYQLFLKDIDEIKQQEVILDQMLKPNCSMPAFR